jgi:hypothetical protein
VFDEAAVGTPQRHQLGVGALLGHDAAAEHHHPVGALHRRQPVRDDQRGAPLHQPLQGLLHERARSRVERAGRLVEDEDARVGLSKARAMAMRCFCPPRQPHPALADQRVCVAVGEPSTKVAALAATAAARTSSSVAAGRP